MQRTISCGALRKGDIGKTVILNGWVHRKRDHGGISFINLRDRCGITQVVIDQDASETLKALATELRNEYCIALEGLVRPRPETMINRDMPTGEIEVQASRLQILSSCEILPFQIDEASEAKEDLRLKYRYLDLRSFGMQRRLKLRNDVVFAVREFLIARDFYEIETPTFIKSTPEGARDYLVPSRLYPGKFYALPQSPQLYKQLLMVSGFDKYFQIARCYRDEDARGDRQPEFTQIDIEMSFVNREDVLGLVEELMAFVFKKTLAIDLPTPFRRLPYETAMDLYGTDKPDLRFGLEMVDFSQIARYSSFTVFQELVAAGGLVKALVVPDKADYSRKQIEELEGVAKIYKAKGLSWMKVQSDQAGGPSLEGGVAKFFVQNVKASLEALKAKPGDLILLVADKSPKIANSALGAVRAKLGKDLGYCKPGQFEFAWIIDFPMFELNEATGGWQTAHHMFTWPQAAYHASLEQDPGSVKGDLYDLVLNGCELASGSIRIHDPELQQRVFSIVGINPAEAEQRFGFLTKAFKYGPPPHGGIAPGLDRLVMLMSGQTSIKEVIAFPKNSFAVNPMDECPSLVDQSQLDDLRLSITQLKPEQPDSDKYES